MGLIAGLLRSVGIGRTARTPEGGFFSAADLPDASAHADLGSACARVATGDVRGALERFRVRAAAGAGDAGLARVLQAALLEALGRGDEAKAAFAALPQADAGVLALAFFNRGRVHLNHGRLVPAERCLRLAARLAPGAAQPVEALGFAAYLVGDANLARERYDRALALATPAERDALALNRLLNTLPQVAADADEFPAARAWFDTELARLATAGLCLDDPLGAINRTAFHLSYQGGHDRDLLARLAALFLAACPALGEVACAPAGHRDASRRLRVGVLSLYLGRHSVGVWYRGLVRRLIESGRHEVVLITAGTDVDPRLRETAREHGAHVELDFDLVAARRRVAALGLDMLIYTDVQMHPFPYFLAMSRLAPVQALMVGHPSTSGIPALDHFIGNIHQDGPDTRTHYSETLARLPVIPVWVEPTAPPAVPVSRAELGLAPDRRLYVCPALLQKMHPDFDRALADILARDPDGEIVLFADRERAQWQARLEARFERSIGEAAARIAFRPFAAPDAFLSVLLAADCVLDPYHFSGGVTTYIVLSMGAALVTLPGETLRSRMSAGILAQAGVTDGVARSHEHFVELALAFARDPARRADLRARLEAARGAIFCTETAVGALEDWIAATLAAR